VVGTAESLGTYGHINNIKPVVQKVLGKLLCATQKKSRRIHVNEEEGSEKMNAAMLYAIR